jgi:hypothetical protein
LQGLEVEVQKLIVKHRSDMTSCQERAAEEMARAATALKDQQLSEMKVLKERLLKVRPLMTF